MVADTRHVQLVEPQLQPSRRLRRSTTTSISSAGPEAFTPDLPPVERPRGRSGSWSSSSQVALPVPMVRNQRKRSSTVRSSALAATSPAADRADSVFRPGSPSPRQRSVFRSRTMTAPPPPDEAWQTPRTGRLKPELVRPCIETMHEQAKRLPFSMPDLRLARNRMPRSASDRSLRRGAPVSNAADMVALDVVERWARQLQEAVPPTYLGMAIAELVHSEHAELPAGPLRGGLHRMVPKPHHTLLNGWEFMDDLQDILDLETKFDRSKHIHAGAPAPDKLLSLVCGKPPTVWCRGAPRSDFARTGFSPAEYGRGTAYHCSRDHQGRVHVAKPIDTPGPGSYPGAHCLGGLQSPQRSIFAPSGGPRPACTVSMISFRPRDLFD